MSKKFLQNKTIFLTGGTGSFGRFFTSEALKKGAKKIIIFSRDEDKQYSMQFDYQKHKNKLEFIIGDVRDKSSINRALAGAGVDILVHAAALKQLPSAEYNILEAVKTNILGAQNVVDAAIEAGISKIIGISTDKAVEPINVYGTTKSLQEKIFVLGNKQSGGKNKFSTVRYGNVVNSRGSIIPLFKKQLDTGMPLTITHRDMTRFILTLNQASDLVFSALEKMKGGEIFVPKIKPLRITDLAETIIETLKPGTKIEEIGVRPGEKIHETLISDSEWRYADDQKNYFAIYPQIKIKGTGFSYSVVTKKKPKILNYSSANGPFLTKIEIKKILKAERIL